MKVQVLHDSDGNIHAYFAPAATSSKRRGQLIPNGPDRVVTEIDIPQITLEPSIENQDKVVESLERVFMDVKLVSGRLVHQNRPRY
jgi:hypothetical protein